MWILLFGNQVTKFLYSLFRRFIQHPLVSLLGSALAQGTAISIHLLMQLTNMIVQGVSQLHA